MEEGACGRLRDRKDRDNMRENLWRQSLGMLLGIFFVLLAVGCSPQGGKEPTAKSDTGYTVTDARGQQVHIPHKPERILTLATYSDEMVLGLVPSSRMVAISRFLDDPLESVVVEKAKRIPRKVGDPSVEEIFSWQPDIVIASEWTSVDKIQALTDLGIPVVVCSTNHSYDDIQKSLRLIAASLDEKEKGEQIRQKMDAIRDEITAKVAKIPPEKRKSVVLLSLMTSYGGAGSTFDDMCRHAGVINASAAIGLKNGQTLTKELLVKSNPDILLLPSFNDKGAFDPQVFIDSYLQDPSLQTVKAIREGAFCYPRESYIYNASQDVVFGIQELAYCAYGEEFRQEDNRHISFSGEE